jgi:hypothetical protein
MKNEMKKNIWTKSGKETKRESMTNLMSAGAGLDYRRDVSRDL